MFKLARNNSLLLTILIFSLLSLDVSAIDLFGKKVSKTISYQILDREFNSYHSLTSEQNNALLALEAYIQGASKKKIAKQLGVSIHGTKSTSANDFTKALSVHEVVLFSETSNSNMAGIMEFSDETGRSVKFWFDTNIAVDGKNTNVTMLALNLMMQANTEIELFLVPEDSIDTSILYATENYVDLYNKIKGIAVNKIIPASTESHDYVAIAFYKELIAPGINVKMKISDQKNDNTGLDNKSRYKLIKNAWLVTVLPINTNLANDKTWIKITMQSEPGRYGAELKNERLIGLFSLNSYFN